jgi:hypothetical protein
MEACSLGWRSPAPQVSELEPVRFHPAQKFLGKFAAAQVTQNAVNSASRTKGRLTDTGSVLVDPLAYLVGTEGSAAVETATHRTGHDVGPVSDRVLVSALEVRCGRRQGILTSFRHCDACLPNVQAFSSGRQRERSDRQARLLQAKLASVFG